MQRRNVVSALALMLGALGAQASDEWPARPIRVVVPYAPGGVVDVQTRAVAQRMAQELGQPVVVEPRPGASANVGAEAVARAAPDGYTLLVSAAFLINNPLLSSNLRWKPENFVPIARFALSPSYFAVPISLGVNSVKDYVDLAKAKRPPLQYGDGGTGAPQTVANEVFKALAGLPIEGVSYQGAPPILPDLGNGLLSMAVLPSTVAQTAVQTGRIKVIANFGATRSVQMPDVPTIAEAGYPGASVLSWYGLHAPAGTPAAVLKRIDDAVRAATRTDEVKTRLISAGGEEAYQGQAEFTEFIKADTERWKRITALTKR